MQARRLEGVPYDLQMWTPDEGLPSFAIGRPYRPDDFDAHEIFDNLNGDLKIQPIKVGFAAFYESIGRVDLMEKHPDEKPVFISGKDVRATLQQGEMVDPRIMRESTSEILAAAMKQD